MWFFLEHGFSLYPNRITNHVRYKLFFFRILQKIYANKSKPFLRFLDLFQFYIQANLHLIFKYYLVKLKQIFKLTIIVNCIFLYNALCRGAACFSYLKIAKDLEK